MGQKNYVIMREPCPVCEGRRIIKDPTRFWSKLARAEAEAPGGRFDELTYVKYMMDHYIDPQDPATWPSEEETCDVCDVNGILEIRTSLDGEPEPDEAAVPGAYDEVSCHCGPSDTSEANEEICECS